MYGAVFFQYTFKLPNKKKKKKRLGVFVFYTLKFKNLDFTL